MLPLTPQKYLKSAAIIAAMLFSTSALAQAQNWQGTWDTNYGQLKLVERNGHVYGDYGSWGTIQGILGPGKRKLRAIYTRADDNSRGYIEWSLRSPNKMEGRWVKWERNLPIWDSRGTQWNGSRKRSSRPSLSVFSGNTGSASFIARSSSKYRYWVENFGRNVFHPWMRAMPATAELNFDYTPPTYGFGISGMSMGNDERSGWELYGTAGLYAYCGPTQEKYTTFPTWQWQPDSNAKKGGRRVIDISRKSAKGSTRNNAGLNGALNFQNADTCLRSGKELRFQIQTNLIEKDTAPRTDDRFGYRGFVFTSRDLPMAANKWTRVTGGTNIGGTKVELKRNSNRYSWAYRITTPRDPAKPNAEVLTITGYVSFGQGGCPNGRLPNGSFKYRQGCFAP